MIKFVWHFENFKYYIQQKSVEEIAELDKDDEALVKYKQALLGDAVGKWVQSANIAVFVNSYKL